MLVAPGQEAGRLPSGKEVPALVVDKGLRIHTLMGSLIRPTPFPLGTACPAGRCEQILSPRYYRSPVNSHSISPKATCLSTLPEFPSCSGLRIADDIAIMGEPVGRTIEIGGFSRKRLGLASPIACTKLTAGKGIRGCWVIAPSVYFPLLTGRSTKVLRRAAVRKRNRTR